jgi:hypothetical protein
MNEIRLTEEKIIYSLKNENAEMHIGEYFQVIFFNDAYYLYYNCENKIKLVISESLSFVDKKSVVVIENAPGGCFCVIEDGDRLKMLCGSHVSNQEHEEVAIPDLVWPLEQRTLLNPDISRKDRKNGMYLLSSNDGVMWNQIYDKPVLNGLCFSDSCPLGSIAFDTSPYIIKKENIFYYYGRLNMGLDERDIYCRTSTDLIEWTAPERIFIENINSEHLKQNYYNAVVFQKQNTMYMLCPYFECCGTKQRNCKNGKTLLLKSENGMSWRVIKYCSVHDGKYKHRVNDILVGKEKSYLFFRANIPRVHQQLVSYNLNI